MSRADISSHSNIIRLSAWGYDYPSFDTSILYPVLIIEKAIGSLKTFFENDPPSTAVKHHLCLDIAEGLRHVHSCNIVHGDIKPDNILVVESTSSLVPFTAKLADFGAFIDLGLPPTERLTYSMYTGTQDWKPPEVCQTDARTKEVIPRQLFLKCDAYAFGLLIFSTFLRNGQQPFVTDSSGDWKHNLSIPLPLATILQTQVIKLLSLEPTERPAVSADLLSDNSEIPRNWYVGVLWHP